MRKVRGRILVFLVLLYVVLFFVFYQYVWHSRRNDAGNLFDSPGEDDLPHLRNDIVQFNFKRRNGPPLMESNDTFDAFGYLNNSSIGDDLMNSSVVPSVQNPVLDRPNIPPNHNHRGRIDSGLINSSLEEGEFTSHMSKHTSKSLEPVYDVSHLDPPNYCVHAFYYMWYGNPEFDSRYYHWNHRYLPHWQQSVTNQYPKGRHSPPDDIGASFYPGQFMILELQ